MSKPDLTITADQARDLLVNLSAGFAFCRALIDSGAPIHPAYVAFMQENLALRDVLMDGLGVTR